MSDNSLEIVMKKIMTGSLLCCLMIVLIAAVCFFSIKTTETKVCSGKWEVILSLTQNDKEITVTDPRKEIEDFVIFGVRACDEPDVQRLARTWSL